MVAASIDDAEHEMELPIMVELYNAALSFHLSVENDHDNKCMLLDNEAFSDIEILHAKICM